MVGRFAKILRDWALAERKAALNRNGTTHGLNPQEREALVARTRAMGEVVAKIDKTLQSSEADLEEDEPTEDEPAQERRRLPAQQQRPRSWGE